MGLLTLGKNYLYWTFSFVIAGLLVNTKSKIWRTFWSVLFVVTIIAFFLHSASTLIEYLAFEKTTVIRLYSASSAPFPAVTICNLNPFKNSAVNQSTALSNLISAYQYTLEKKAADSASSTSSSAVNVRKKRAPPCDRTQQASVKAPSQPSKQNYVIEGYSCSPSSYNLTYGLCGTAGLTITLSNISTVNYNLYSQDIDKGVYLCFHDQFCNNLCDTWDSGLDALTNLTECAKSNFNYPPETNGFNFMALLAEGYSSYCNLDDKGCKLGLYKKKSTEYPGNYWYKDCYYGQPFGYNANLLTMVMEGCDNTTTYEFDTYLLSTCTGYVKNVSDVFSDVLDETDCGTTCGTCPLTGTSNLCFYNQQNLCTFYKKCTTTGSSTTPQSTTRQSTSTVSTTKQSTTVQSSTITTIKSSTVQSTSSLTSTVSTSSSATTARSTSAPTSSTNALTTRAATTLSEATTISTTELSETQTLSTTTGKDDEEQGTTTSYSPTTEDKTTLEEETSILSTPSSNPTLSFSDASQSTVKSSLKPSPDFSSTTKTIISSSSPSSKSTTSIIESSTTTVSTSSLSTTSSKSPKPITLPAITTINTQSTIKWPNLSTTTKPLTTTSNIQIITSKSTPPSSSKASSSITATTSQATSNFNNITPTKALPTLPVTPPFDSHSIPTTVNNPTVTNVKDALTETSSRTTKIITTTGPHNEIPLTSSKMISPTSSIKTSKSENPAFITTAENPVDPITKMFQTTTSVPSDGSENDETDPLPSDFTTIINSKTTSPLFATNENQIISSTLKINTSHIDATVSPSPNTIIFTSTSSSMLNATSTSMPTKNIATSTLPITMKITTKSTSFPTTNKQVQSSTVKVTKTKTSQTPKTTSVIPKTTTSSSSSKTTTKPTTTNIDNTTLTTTKGISSSTTDFSESLTTKKTAQTTTQSSATVSSSVFTNPLSKVSSTTTIFLPTQSSKTSTSITTSSPTSLFLNQTTSTTSTKADLKSTTTSAPTNSVNSVTTTSTKPTEKITNQYTTPSNYLTTTSPINELESLSKSYKLNSSQSSITIETNAQQALITIAASLSEAEKEALGYKIGDLIQTCIIDGVPCNIGRDFTQIYDVDYGYCYTFNYNGLYNTTQSGSNHGLKMVVLSDINEYIATSSEQGIKVVVHYQEESPFPNVDGYRSATGKQIDLRVTYGLVSRLDAPYGVCNSLDKLKELNQPFYFNGTYTVEGCYRSCFQQKISIACNCSDPRFPLPTDLSTTFCKISDTKKYECYEKYIEDNGDYFNVEDCSCAIACDETTFNSAVYYSNWPYGTFFYQALCTNATLMNGTDCQTYYRENGVLVQVSYARLGYETIEEEPVNTAFDLFNNLAGNTGLWIGFSAITVAEIVLIFVQVGLWICTPWELKEVPSCRQRNYPEPEENSENNTEETDSTGTVTGAGGIAGAAYPFYSNLFNGDADKPRHLFEPKSFPNDLRRRHPGTMITDPSSAFESIKPVSHVDVYDSQLINPTPVHSAANESAPEL